MEFKEEDYLSISGIQHFVFCKRQWALIHIEQNWLDNYKTIKGDIMHEKAHDNSIKEKRGDTYIVRGLKVSSSMLGIVGECDVVEFIKSIEGVDVKSLNGLYKPVPIEYKSGSPREDLSNELQLCAQAMCLEEMLCCDIDYGYIFFGEIKRREKIIFSNELRIQLLNIINEMHKMYDKKQTPKVKKHNHCDGCSLSEICLPKLINNKNVGEYIKEKIEE